MAEAVRIATAHTAELDAATLAAARELLVEAFDGELSDDDWEHALGGVHALAWDGAELVGHGSVVQRRLLHRGRALRAGYVEGLAVRASHRRRGYGGALMDALERVIHGAYELGALSATDAAVALYEARGWQRWLGSAFALTPTGLTRTADDDGVYVLPVAIELDRRADLACDWRDGDLW
jgi:aminoglycoside 2'-N-acetyltransferase I